MSKENRSYIDVMETLVGEEVTIYPSGLPEETGVINKVGTIYQFRGPHITFNLMPEHPTEIEFKGERIDLQKLKLL